VKSDCLPGSIPASGVVLGREISGDPVPRCIHFALGFCVTARLPVERERRAGPAQEFRQALRHHVASGSVLAREGHRPPAFMAIAGQFGAVGGLQLAMDECQASF